MRRATPAAFPVVLFLTAGMAATAIASGPGYYRYPSLSKDTIVFTAEGDLWTVPATGGVAQRLTSHPGQEDHAAISPDGAGVAFTGTYEGPAEVYVMPVAGGLPRRLTWDGATDTVVGWTPDGRVLYMTWSASTLPEAQLASVDPATGTRTVLPLAQASDGCYDGDGTTLYFTRLPFQGSHTKRYVGGMAQQIWVLRPGAGEAVCLTADYDGTSKTPMWWQGRVFFVSDRDGTMNLWSMAPDGSDLRQLTRHDGWDVETPSLSAGRIAYKLGADLYLHDIAAQTDTRLDVTLASDFDQTREKWVDKPMEYLTAAHLSPSGDRVVLTARGQVFVAPIEQGRLVEATRHAGVRYRSTHFLPNGKQLVALSDESGEVEWWRLPANGVGEPAQITNNGHVLRFDGVPSPDGTLIAYTDKDQELWIVRIADGVSTKIASSPRWGFGGLAWSPDSAWLAYSVPADNMLGQIKLYRVADGKRAALTDDRTNSDHPAWSPDGKWIYFLSDRHLDTAVPGPWGTYQPEPFLAKPTQVFAVALEKAARFPFAPDDELKPAAQAENGEKTKAGKNGKKPVTVTAAIDLDGLQGRLYEVPVPPGDYSALATNGERLFYLSHEVGRSRGGELLAVDISAEKPKPATLADDVADYELSADGKKVLVRKRDALAVFAANVKKVDLAEARVDLSSWRFTIEPREEWRQMFREAWRLERDYFYDRGMNGVDWKAMLAKYGPLVDRVSDREELSDLLAQMVSELGALHIFVRGGDVRKGRDDILPASLGALLQRDEKAGGWDVARIYNGDPAYPDQISPLARPSVDLHEGDVIEAINGVATLTVTDPSELLRDQAGKQVLLRVRPASGGAARDVVVEPITPREAADLRYSAWEESRRERVEKLGGGAIGYVHLRAMTGKNYEEWARQYYPVFNRQGLVIDMRHNRGGNIDSWILEKLMRKAWFYWRPRAGDTYWNMQFAFRGPMVVIVDQRTASDGEAFSEGFRRLDLGKVIGMRTWGGEIWLSSSNFLVDHGIATAAETGVFGPEGKWLIEGWGVVPDIAVDNLPLATFEGGDAQLDEAVRILKEEIAKHPNPVPEPPQYPARAEDAPVM
jgi:tricorn protease